MRAFFAVTLLVAGATAAQDELSALANQGAWAELLEKAEKTPPAVRKDAWRQLVARAAAAVVKSAPPGKDGFDALGRADALVQRYGFLADTRPFPEARDEAVLAAAGRCQDLGDDCWKRLGAWEPKLTPAGSLALGRFLRKAGFVAWRPMPLFARAVSEPAACRDPDVLASTLASLDTPEDSPAAAAARQVAFERCWDVMKPALQESLRGASSYRLRNACAAMRAKKALSELQADLCADEGR